MLSPWPFFAVLFFFPLTMVIGGSLGGPWTLLTLVAMFGAVPMLDELLGREPRNPTPDDEGGLLADHRFDRLLYLYAATHLALLGWALWRAGTLADQPWVLAGFALAAGLSNGAIGFTVSHELVHRTNERKAYLAGHALLHALCYPHWGVEHVAGHHRYVGTPRDPATARRGESVFAFLPRSIAGGHASAWRIEGERLHRLGLPAWHPRNRIQAHWALQVAIIAVMAWLLPWPVVAWFLGQAAVAILLLETINYVEHYGLTRRKLADARPGAPADAGFERVTPMHSWNQNNRLTNHLLLNLQRHADHHAHADRPFPLLRHFPGAPQLPTGYAGMVLVALVPPLWFRVMDPRVDAVRERVERIAAWEPSAVSLVAAGRGLGGGPLEAGLIDADGSHHLPWRRSISWVTHETASTRLVVRVLAARCLRGARQARRHRGERHRRGDPDMVRGRRR